MKIYFIGAPGSGKTTLARYVSKRSKLPILTDTARSVLTEWDISTDDLKSEIESADEYYKAVFMRHMQEELELDGFVSDGLFDTLARSVNSSNVGKILLSNSGLLNYIESLRGGDSFIFFVRPLQEQHLRWNITREEVISLDAMIKFMLELWDLKYFIISSLSIQERIRSIDSVMNLLKIPNSEDPEG